MWHILNKIYVGVILKFITQHSNNMWNEEEDGVVTNFVNFLFVEAMYTCMSSVKILIHRV